MLVCNCDIRKRDELLPFFFEGCLIETSSMPLKDDTSRKIVAAESLFISLKGRGLALFFFLNVYPSFCVFAFVGGEGRALTSVQRIALDVA